MIRSLFTTALLALPISVPAGEHLFDFEAPLDETQVRVLVAGDTPPPKAERGALSLTNFLRARNESRAVHFHEASLPAVATVDVSFEFMTGPGARGFSIVLLNDGSPSPEASLEWDEPNHPGAFGVAFDIYNPPTSHWFDANGNYKDNPQAEVSLHWDGRELHNALSPVDFRDGESHKAVMRLRHVAGGVFVDVRIDGEIVHDAAFVSGMTIDDATLLVGARTGELTAPVVLDDLRVAWEGDAPASVEPVVAHIFEDARFHSRQRRIEQDVAFPELPENPERVVLHLRLEEPPGGFDTWDRGGSVGLYDDDGAYIELARLITPFGTPGHWTADVTHLRTLLSGARVARMNIDTWQDPGEDPEKPKGWQADVWIEAWPGAPAPPVIAVEPLWSGEPEYGNPEKPEADFYVPLEVSVPDGAASARLFLTVTGHGMAAQNAAEFLPTDRTLTINGEAFPDRLWREDCYLNPVRPQQGTWKFDRAGWCPGEIVPPWEIDLTPFLDAGAINLEYDLMDYVNTALPDTRALHIVEGCVVFYGE